jgi:hypothetical protein
LGAFHFKKITVTLVRNQLGFLSRDDKHAPAIAAGEGVFDVVGRESFGNYFHLGRGGWH